ncbi:ABC transporter substrate-binding protein [Gordonia sp. KTR9]|uniref:ABC transporter substrate-binding protein n=1 Tax=Gordonia sp. KTR9 TaxID=337191 RepID=UPI00027DE9E5|nr:ABC transporter substrate-binding protein [Gordonia sp. KTR9]AFR49416.1 hypothetical protein KTR9_2779 [Gordonia sp. KTR9]
MKTFRGSRSAPVVAAAAAAVALTGLAACSNDDSADSSSSASVAAPEGSFPGKAAAGDPVKIGLINNEGGQAISQPENREAAEAVVKYANENLGGIGGRPIELVTCKNTEDPNSARDCANQMVEANVSAVLVTSTGSGDSMAPIITGAGIPYVSAAGQAPSELTSDNAYMWTGGLPGTLQSMATYAGEKNMKKVTAYTIDVPAAISGLESVGTPSFKAKGVDLKIVPIPPGTPDATPQVSAGLGDNPEGVIVIGESNLCTAAFKALGTLGTTADRMSIQPCAAPSVVQAVGSSLDGVHVFSPADIVSDDPETVLYKSVMDKYSPDTDTTGYAVIGYQGMLGLVRAAQSVQGSDTSPATISKAIASARDVVLPAGHGITFTCDGTAAPGMKSVCSTGSIVSTFEDGELTDPQLVQ